MNILTPRWLALGAVMLLSLSGQARADWAQALDPLVVRPLPANLEVQPQNPPAFSWARHSLNPSGYVIEVKSGATVVKTFQSNRNWYLPSTAFINGTYTWRVRPSSLTDWSSERSFVISAASRRFEIPENNILRAAIAQRPLPLALPASVPKMALWSADLRTARAQSVTWLSNEVIKQTTAIPVLSDSNWMLVTGNVITAANNAQNAQIRTAINVNGRQLEAAALLYRLTDDVRFLNEALSRGDQMAALSPTGPTSYVNQDQGCRVIALSLLRALDSLGANVSAERRAKWLSVVAVRGRDIYKDLSGSNGRMDQYPFDSHGGSNIGFLAIISTLALRDIPEASAWFDFSFRSYVSAFSVWSGPEGGYANGTAYAQYTIDHALQVWQPLGNATGINLFDKPWAAGFMKFFMHFVPPGSKTHVFGDEAEIAPDARFMKAYSSRFATPEAAWYSRSLPGNEDSLILLQAPYPLPVAASLTATAPANAALYPSIGWVAMHSNLSDLNRTSIYFKSSPYGSFNHSHGDQNSFVLSSAGVPLLSESGWYDYYGSPLWTSWYRQTKAHNAVTFNGGVGQMVDGYGTTMLRNGKVTAFSTSATVDYAAGDATAAYGGALTAATRKMWYLRSQDALVVLDNVASATLRTFEWNFHALAPIVVEGTNASISNGGRSVCVRPISSMGMRLETRVGPPPKVGTYEAHAVYLGSGAALAQEFLILIDVGCKKPLVSITATASGRTLKVGAQTVTLPK